MKKLLTILLLIMLIISLFRISSMYALYKEKIQGEYSTLLGAWTIKVNETDITSSGQVETFTISENQLGYVDSEYIQAGKIAPEGQAYFDIVIDPTNTDVSIMYTIDVSKNAKSSTDATVELTDAIELINGENYFGQGTDGQTNKVVNDTVVRNENSYTSIIPIDKINGNYKNYIRLYLKWSNVVKDEIEINNSADSALGEKENQKLTIPIEINLKQYMGEVINNEP